mmetsp:Transcript_21337/g.46474  ORF Transcript_21337/g.46474 Transcript_21337/m.46474 type:complete len:259 (+) Transcript_21337:98-874(+)
MHPTKSLHTSRFVLVFHTLPRVPGSCLPLLTRGCRAHVLGCLSTSRRRQSPSPASVGLSVATMRAVSPSPRSPAAAHRCRCCWPWPFQDAPRPPTPGVAAALSWRALRGAQAPFAPTPAATRRKCGGRALSLSSPQPPLFSTADWNLNSTRWHEGPPKPRLCPCRLAHSERWLWCGSQRQSAPALLPTRLRPSRPPSCPPRPRPPLQQTSHSQAHVSDVPSPPFPPVAYAPTPQPDLSPCLLPPSPASPPPTDALSPG